MKETVVASRQAVEKPTLTEKNLKRLDVYNELNSSEILVTDLDYPCKDKSYGVNDFSSWSYFKDRKNNVIKKELIHNGLVEKTTVQRPLHNIKASQLWCDALLDRIDNQSKYAQEPEIKPISKVKQTKIHKIRMRAAKNAMAKWNNVSLASNVDANSTVDTVLAVDTRRFGRTRSSSPNTGKMRSQLNSPSLGASAAVSRVGSATTALGSPQDSRANTSVKGNRPIVSTSAAMTTDDNILKYQAKSKAVSRPR